MRMRMAWLIRILLALGLLSAGTPVFAQSTSSTIRVYDGSGNVVAVGDNSNTAIRINCVVGCGGGSAPSIADAGAFVVGTSLISPIGALFDDTPPTALASNGKISSMRITANRALHINLRNASGAEVGVAAVPIQVSLANTATNATAVKVDGSGVTQPVSGTLAAITATVVTKPLDGCSTTNYDASGAFTSSVVAVTATSTCVDWILISNTTSGTTTTALIEDGAGTPFVYVPTLSVPAASTVEYHPAGKIFTSGIKVQAGANTVLNYAIKGRQ